MIPMDDEPPAFLRPRLVGERFKEHAIPLELLKDLAAFEELLVETAKWKYRGAHPDRKRMPRGFTEAVSLMLKGVEAGSAIPVLDLPDATRDQPTLQAYRDCAEGARDSIAEALEAAAKGENITPFLPKHLLGYFDRFGRGLRDGEYLELRPGNVAKPARLDKSIRKVMLEASQLQNVTEEMTLRGTVPQADQEKMTFELQVADGTRLSAPVSAQHLETVLEAFQGYRKGVRVLLQGIVSFDRLDRPQGIDAMEHISLLDPNDVPTCLEELKALKDEWLDGKGLAPSAEGLDWFATQFETQYAEELPLPFIYPTPEGGIQAEWTLGQTEISLTVDLASGLADWHSLDLDSDNDLSHHLDLNRSEDWIWIQDQIRALAVALA